MCTQQRLRSAWASAQGWSESSLSAWRKLGSLAAYWVHSEDSDQTRRMPRLIWVFAGRTCHIVGFVTRRLIYTCIYITGVPIDSPPPPYDPSGGAPAAQPGYGYTYPPAQGGYNYVPGQGQPVYAGQPQYGQVVVTYPVSKLGFLIKKCNFQKSAGTANHVWKSFYWNKAKKCVCFGFQFWKKLVWLVGITFYFVKIFYIQIAFFNTFFPIFQQMW